MSAAANRVSSPLVGVALAAGGWAAFSLQDAIIKSLVVSLPAPEILFARSTMIVLAASLALRRSEIAVVAKPRNLMAIGMRSTLILAAWLSYYTAARSLALPQMVTLYFAAPLFVVALSRVTLGENPGPGRWAATLVGFVGVLVAADFNGSPSPLPALLVLFAALCWAMTALFTRSLSLSISTAVLMVSSNLVFVVVCGAMAPFIFVRPSPAQLGLLILLSLFGGIGQYLSFQALRIAPASLVAPFEYSSLAWAMLWSWLFFGVLPSDHVLAGGAIILGSGLFMLVIEGRRRIAAARA